LNRFTGTDRGRNDMLDRLLSALGWYLSIFLWLYFTGIGIPPCPEEAGILYAAGLTALHPEVVWWIAWPSAALGIIAADLTLYAIGRASGPRLFQYKWVKKIMKPDRRERIEKQFAKHGLKILLLARFLPPLRTGVFIIAGAARFSLVEFLIADLIYGVVGVGLFFFFGTWVIELFHRFGGHWVAYVALGAVAVYLLYRYYQYLNARELRQAPPLSVLELPAPTPDGGATGAAKSDTASLPR
jgi:membrane protein DedA with SNARE-associated domain